MDCRSLVAMYSGLTIVYGRQIVCGPRVNLMSHLHRCHKLKLSNKISIPTLLRSSVSVS